uniref:OTU domain-containing protein n=1 Tax=Heterorhabditis bacteriophora TaxID=37862 RepID=A0A1I7X4L4_HETBA
MKKSAKCGNKQKQKETTSEIERLEREQLLRHEKEVVDVEAQLLPSLDNIFVKENTVEEQKQDPSFYKEFTVKPKNKRKQARRSEATRRMQDAMNEDRVNASSSLRFTEMLAINKVLDERNLQLVDIPADGDCLYNAVTNQLHRIKGFEHVTGKDIRRRAAHYISDHKDEFVPFLTNDNGEPLDEFEFEQYCSKVENESREGGIWGGEPELNALSRSLERKIELDGYYKCKAAQMVQLEDCLRKRGGLRVRREFRNGDESESVLLSESVKAVGEHRYTIKRKLKNALKHFDAYEALCEQVEAMRSEKYDSGNEEHEKKLINLWELLMPDKPILGRIGKQWRDIGFQVKYFQFVNNVGDDPATDFRGMGILSLDQLIYFAREHENEMRSILGLSHHPTLGFPMAVAGITITSLTRHLLCTGRLKKHFYNSLENPVEIADFHHAYCRIFTLFIEYWKRANPPSIMNFNSIRMDFEQGLASLLDADCANLNMVTISDLR